VKSRTRLPGTETESVYLFRDVKGDREKLTAACISFSCDPWIAVYAECDAHADLFLTSLANYDQKYRALERKVDGWTMTEKRMEVYRADSEVRYLRIHFDAPNWWKSELTSYA
jgi:hypothetical protein